MDKVEMERRLWFVFGTSADGAVVDIASTENTSLIEKVPAHLASHIIEEHNRAILSLMELE